MFDAMTIVTPLGGDANLGYSNTGTLYAQKRAGESIIIIRPVNDARGHTCGICGRGWELTAESFLDQQTWSLKKGPVHSTCYVRFISLMDKRLYRQALVEAKLRFDEDIIELDSHYWVNDPVWKHRLWYRVRLLDHQRTLLLGFRKRVHHLEISDGDGEISTTNAHRLFLAEDVTKGVRSDVGFVPGPQDWSPRPSPDGYFIHAWNEGKVLEYIKVFAEILGLK